MPTETLYISTVFLAGVLSFLSPCIVPLLPVYLSTLASPAAGAGCFQPQAAAVSYERCCSSRVSPSPSWCWALARARWGKVLNSRVFMIVMGALVVLLGIHQTGLFTSNSWSAKNGGPELKRAKRSAHGRCSYPGAFCSASGGRPASARCSRRSLAWRPAAARRSTARF